MSVLKEEQSMTQRWIWCILCTCVALCGWGVIRQMTIGIDLEEKSISVLYLVLLFSIPCLALLYFYKNKLYTRYDQEGIKIKYFPFTHTLIRWNDIQKVEFIELDLFTHSVWQSEKYGTVYHSQGKKLLQLETTSGKFLIGTSRQEEVEQIISTYKVG
ncbi:MAG: hypothetical protein K0R51_928 [Cytophagaceae bacterium]|jgi:hypothetical protein|nr:hypothetical protein [Cytophagaceae bacterium]